MLEKQKTEKEHGIRLLKEKYEEEHRREGERYEFQYDKLRDEIRMMQKRLGQEEHLNKELAILNNKLQNNLGEVKAPGRYRDPEPEVGYGFRASTHEDYTAEDALNERKRAWEDLDRESEEVKRKIRSHMR